MRFIRTALLCLLLSGSSKGLAQMPNMLDSILAIFPQIKSDMHPKVGTEKTGLINPLGVFAQALRTTTYRKKPSTDPCMQPGLWVRRSGQLYQYRDEQLFLTDGYEQKALTKRDLDRALRKTLNSLIKLEHASLYARNIIHTLQQSENRFEINVLDCISSYMVLPILEDRLGMLNNNAYAFQIIDTKELVVDYAPFNKIGSGAEVRWHPSQKLICLAHELSHAYDANFGLLDDRLHMINGKAMMAREVRALYHENIIRKELNRDLRSQANGTETMIVDGQPMTYPLPMSARR